MIKIKNNKFKIFTSLLFSFAIALLCIIFFSCKTYAFTINNDGNLVGDNQIEYNMTLLPNISNNNREFVGSASIFREDTLNRELTNDIIFETNTKYTLSFNYKTDNISSSSLQIGFFYTDNTNNFYDLPTNFNYSFLSFTSEQNKTIDYIRFGYSIDAVCYIKNIYLNIGSTPQQYEPYGVWYSQNNYNDMENYYNDLLGNNSNVLYNSLYGKTCLLVDSNNYNTVFAQDIMYPSTDTITFSSISLPNISNYLNNYDSENTTTYPTPYLALIINFNYQITNSLMFQYDNTTLDVLFKFNNTIANNSIEEHRDTTYPYFSIQNKDRFVYNQLIYDGFYLPDYLSIDFNLSIDGVSYANGFQDGINSQQTYINILKNEKQQAIDDLNNRLNIANNSINELSSNIETLKALNEQLQENMQNSLSWSSLFFAFADTPFKVVSNVLGFELFGLNLFSTFIGMITVFGVVYLLKKFF